jgi:dephospho-CoA kinase
MLILGLTGGVASGKSLVAGLLARHGAVVLDADRAGHEALRLPHVEEAIRCRFGPGVFGLDGRVDRLRLARLVFDQSQEGTEARRDLETMTHPEIARLLSEQIQAVPANTPLAVVDAALLFEAGWDKLCGKLAFVDAPPEVRLARAKARGWTAEEFAAREAAQESLDFKRRRADVVIDNSGRLEDTQLQVQRFWPSLVG